MRSVASIPCPDSQNKLQRTFDRFQSRILFILKILFILSLFLHSRQCKIDPAADDKETQR